LISLGPRGKALKLSRAEGTQRVNPGGSRADFGNRRDAGTMETGGEARVPDRSSVVNRSRRAFKRCVRERVSRLFSGEEKWGAALSKKLFLS